MQKQAKNKKMEAAKAELIERLLAKASLEFKCCGHGHNNKKVK